VKVAVFGKRFGNEFLPYCHQLFNDLQKIGSDIVIYAPFFEFLKSEMDFEPQHESLFYNAKCLIDCDLMFSIGGDGTFLEAITLVRDLDIPIAGINSGRLGFLADISKEEITQAVAEIDAKQYRIRSLDVLKVLTPENPFGEFNFALNELALSKRDSSSMITVHAWLDGEFLNSYWADGVIVATSTGSTAYSLSVGGPIVHPLSPNFVVSPIAPHNLSVRPLVIPNSMELKLKVDARGGKFMISLDSRSHVMNQGVEIIVRKADFSIKVVERYQNSYYNTLRNKLMWGADRRN